MTVFNIDANSTEVKKLLGGQFAKVEAAIETELLPTFIYEGLIEKAEEMILAHLHQIDQFDFQKLVAGLLHATGFKIIRVSSPRAEGGFDIDAAQEMFEFESPRIKVQWNRIRPFTPEGLFSRYLSCSV